MSLGRGNTFIPLVSHWHFGFFLRASLKEAHEEVGALQWPGGGGRILGWASGTVAESGRWRQSLPTCKESRLWDTGPGAILKYAVIQGFQYTYLWQNCYVSLWPWMYICGADESMKAVEKLPSIFSHTLSGRKVLKNELIETWTWRCFLGSFQEKLVSSSHPS